MDHITKINHNIRIGLSLGLVEYAIADIIQNFKKPVSCSEVAEYANEDYDYVVLLIESLISLGYATAAPKSGKVSVTPLWKEKTKVKKEEKPVNALIHLIHMAITSEERKVPRPDYEWSSAESRWANELSIKLCNSYRIKNQIEGTNEQIINFFCLVLDNLSDYWNEGFSVSRLNTFYNDVISCARSEIKKKQSKGKIFDNATAIREASNDFTPSRFQ